jgi:hypothetical protein
MYSILSRAIDCVAMPLLTHQEVAERRLFFRRGLLVCLAIVAFVVTLANRTFRLSRTQTTTVHSTSVNAKIQHRDNDAFQWSAPLAMPLLLWSSAPFRRIVLEGKPPLPLRVDDCLYNRPPPIS